METKSELLFLNKKDRNSIFFIENILPKSFLSYIAFLFHTFMYSYVKLFYLLIIIYFVANEFVNKVATAQFLLFVCYFHFSLVVIAYYFHCRLRDLVGTDVNKLIFLNMTNNIDKRTDPISLITLLSLRIPSEFETEHPHADLFLRGAQETPFMHNLAWTIMDYAYLRFSWIKVLISNPESFINSLEIGDVILYHSKETFIAKFIRFITRCYWEHTATYVGDGKVFNVSPGGIEEINIINWVKDKNVELAVLRNPDESYESQVAKVKRLKYLEDESRAGRLSYGYYSVLVEFWRILTDKKKDGIMKLHIFLVNISLLSIILFSITYNPHLTRLNIFLIAILTPYLFDTIYHWWVYQKQSQLEEIEKCKFYERHEYA